MAGKMTVKISSRLKSIVDALPLRAGMRILEIGCGPGVAAREIVRRLEKVQVVAIDRSANAIRQAQAGSKNEMSTGKLEFRCVAIEEFELNASDEKFDVAFAIRVGALDGRHPELEAQAFIRIAKALKPKGRLFIDGGTPLNEISLRPYR